MSSTEVLALAFLVGVIAGLRSLTAPAVVAWAGYGRGILAHTSFHFMGTLTAAILFTVLAVVELITDQLPSTPSRLKPPGLIARIITGGLSGACLAAAGGQSIAFGAVLGSVGGVAGAFLGYGVRTHLVTGRKIPDLPVALLEDVVAIGGAIFIVSRF
ncbi:MAG TPA: hypothetical protein VN875_11855 [Candidatus Binatus sp.]|nr:hypothetical protein [Candidatus Binatus sp.]